MAYADVIENAVIIAALNRAETWRAEQNKQLASLIGYEVARRFRGRR